MKLKALIPLAATTALAVCNANATVTIYTSQASFLAALASSGVDSFDDLLPSGTQLSGPLSRTAGTFGYSANTTDSMLVSAGTSSDGRLSTSQLVDTLTFSGFSGGVSAAGANVFGSNKNGSFSGNGAFTVTASDASGTVTQTLTSTTQTTFIGFISDSGLLSMSIAGANNNRWITVNDLTLGQTAPVPEPESYALMLSGLAVLGWLMQRRGKPKS